MVVRFSLKPHPFWVRARSTTRYTSVALALNISWFASQPRKPRKYYPLKNTRYTVTLLIRDLQVGELLLDLGSLLPELLNLLLKPLLSPLLPPLVHVCVDGVIYPVGLSVLRVVRSTGKQRTSISIELRATDNKTNKFRKYKKKIYAAGFHFGGGRGPFAPPPPPRILTFILPHSLVVDAAPLQHFQHPSLPPPPTPLIKCLDKTLCCSSSYHF